MDTYATINDMQEKSWNTSYLLGNVYAGMGEIKGMGYCVDDVQMKQTVESQLMVSQGSCSKQSHKSIAQNKMTSCTRMEMLNDAFGWSQATQVHTEDLRLVNLTEFCPSRRGEQSKAPC